MSAKVPGTTAIHPISAGVSARSGGVIAFTRRAPVAVACHTANATNIMWHVVGMLAHAQLCHRLADQVAVGDLPCDHRRRRHVGAQHRREPERPDSIIHLRVAMALVGVGWNFMFTAGTTLLLQTYTPAEKAKVQGINDFFVFGTIAICSLAAGATYQAIGWAAVLLAAMPLLVLVMVAIIWLRGLTGRGYRLTALPRQAAALALQAGCVAHPFLACSRDLFRVPTSALTWSARSRPASPKTTRATRR